MSTSNHVSFFVYHINTIAQESTLLINENERIDNPQKKIVKCAGAKAQYEKFTETFRKQRWAYFVTYKILSY